MVTPAAPTPPSEDDENVAFVPVESSDANRFGMLIVASIGVVYGDIGTSPLYAFKEAVAAASGGRAWRRSQRRFSGSCR